MKGWFWRLFMTKHKYFVLPYDEVEIGAIGGWLESMAGRGLKLERIGRFKVFRFEEASTGKVRYCIYPHMDDACCHMPG